MRNFKRRIKQRKYEISYYHEQLTCPDCPGEPDEEGTPHQEYHKRTRLNDLYFSMPNVLDAYNYAKEQIQTPECESFERVLSDRFIPYSILEWGKLFQITSEKYSPNPVYYAHSEPFLDKEGYQWVIKIKIWCLDGAEDQHSY